MIFIALTTIILAVLIAYIMGCIGSKTTQEEPAPKPSEPAKPAPSETPAPEPAQEEPAPEPAAPEPEPDVAPSGGGFAQELLEAQNVYRSKHGSPAFTLSDALSEGAQKWADHLAAQGSLQHTSEKGVGENLAWSSTKITAQAAADMWYNEIKDYNFSRPGFTSGTGHFTQVVWKSSTEFGAGIAHDSAGCSYVVGRYSPPGNISNPGYFDDNVKQAV